jgi:tRNA modification GTPase
MTPTRISVLTPAGVGAIATLLIEGDEALSRVDALVANTRRRIAETPLRHIVVGRWGGPQGEEIVACRLSPQRIEVHCHGGPAAVRAIVDSLVAAGCQLEGWAESITRAAPDRISGEAAVALAQAPTARTALILLDQAQGALRRELAWMAQLLRQGDFPGASAAIETLLARAPLGLHLVRPWKVVLAGQPNAGKSSLINALVGYERAIVFDLPGTTRDVVTAAAALDGWPVEFADTAGLRPTADPLEQAGIARAQDQMTAADVLVLVFDRTQPWSSADDEFLAKWQRAIVVHHKCDLPAAGSRPRGLAQSAGLQAMGVRRKAPSSGEEISGKGAESLATSVVTGQGLRALQERIVEKLVPQPPKPGAGVPFQPWHVAGLEECLAGLRRGDVASATAALSRLIG